MTDDLLERLREAREFVIWDVELYTEAADEIERLREEVVDLKDLIQSTVNYTGVSVSNQRYTFHKQTNKWYLPEETKND